MPSHRTQVLAWYSWPVGVEVFGVVGTVSLREGALRYDF